MKSITLSVIVWPWGGVGRVRIFRNEPFTRFARRAWITDAELCEGVVEHRKGESTPSLGGCVIKPRIARKGGRKVRRLSRPDMLLRMGEQAFFVHGSAKSDRDNIRNDELAALKKLAGELLNYDDATLAKAVEADVLTGGELMKKRLLSQPGPGLGPRDRGRASQHGVMSKQTMREFDELCLTPVPPGGAEEMKKQREREGAGRAVFARYPVKHHDGSRPADGRTGGTTPQGASLNLFALIAKNGLTEGA